MVTAAYDLTTDSDAWSAKMIALFRAYMDDGFGVYGGVVLRTPPSLLRVHMEGAHPVNHALMDVGISVGFFDRLPESYVLASCVDVLGPDLATSIQVRFREELPAQDHIGVSCPDGTGRYVFVASPRYRFEPPPGHIDRVARRVLPHFASGLRLRHSLTGSELDTASAEAIFDREGRCLHAQGMARAPGARNVLCEAVRRFEAGRKDGRKSATSGEGARQVLLAGRWSLVDRFDSDGRRFVVAYRNPPGVVDPRRLSERERDVASRIAQGKSQKVVAAELGIRPSTVARVATAVIKKLGLRSTRELPLFWKDASGNPVALGASGLMVSSQPDTTFSPMQLTAAEQAVLDQIVQGRSNQEIALQRGTSVRTVANQVAALLHKLDVDSRQALAARVLMNAE